MFSSISINPKNIHPKFLYKPKQSQQTGDLKVGCSLYVYAGLFEGYRGQHYRRFATQLATTHKKTIIKRIQLQLRHWGGCYKVREYLKPSRTLLRSKSPQGRVVVEPLPPAASPGLLLRRPTCGWLWGFPNNQFGSLQGHQTSSQSLAGWAASWRPSGHPRFGV